MTPQDEAHIKALEEENRVLREAMRTIATIHERNYGRQYEKLADIGPIARTALQKEPQS